MRMSFGTLSELLSNGNDVASGDVFAFASLNGRRAKALSYSDTELFLLAKRLDKKRFAALRLSPSP